MNRNNNFTLIHIVAAVMVIYGHQFVLLGLEAPQLFTMPIHNLGVRILFLVSGYLVTTSWYRSDDSITFLKKRIKRLYPPLIVCLLLTVLVLYFISHNKAVYLSEAAKYFFCNLAMRPRFAIGGVFENNPYPFAINGSLWTLPIEIVLYFLLVPLAKICLYLQKKNSKYVVTFLASIFIVLGVIDYYRSYVVVGKMVVFWDTDWLNAVQLGIWFLVGVSYVVLDLQRYLNWQIGCLISVIFFFCPIRVQSVILPFVLGYIVFSFALVEQPLFSRLIKNDICYGMYLYAFPVQQIIINLMYPRVGMEMMYLYFLISNFIVIILATLNYYAVEKY